MDASPDYLTMPLLDVIEFLWIPMQKQMKKGKQGLSVEFPHPNSLNGISIANLIYWPGPSQQDD